MAGNTRGNLVRKEGLCALSALAILAVAAVLYTLDPVGAGTQDQAQAPWVFLGFQQLLRWLPVSLGGLALPALGLGLLVALPWLMGCDGPYIPTYAAPRKWELLAWVVLLAWAGITVWALIA